MSKVIITRPIDMAKPLQTSLLEQGVDSFLFPVMDIQPLSMDVTISFIDCYIFTSRNAVTHGVALLPFGSKTLAIGKGTYEALAEHGFTPDVQPQPPYTSEQFLTQADLPLGQSDHVAIIKGVGGRGVLANQLRKKVASVSTVNVYARKLARPSEKSVSQYLALLENDCRAIFVNSVETLENLLNITPDESLHHLKAQCIVTGSQRVAEAIRQHGFAEKPLLARSMRDQDMIACLLSSR